MLALVPLRARAVFDGGRPVHAVWFAPGQEKEKSAAPLAGAGHGGAAVDRLDGTGRLGHVPARPMAFSAWPETRAQLMECGPRALKGLIDAEITVVAFVVIAVNVCVVVKIVVFVGRLVYPGLRQVKRDDFGEFIGPGNFFTGFVHFDEAYARHIGQLDGPQIFAIVDFTGYKLQTTLAANNASIGPADLHNGQVGGILAG